MVLSAPSDDTATINQSSNVRSWKSDENVLASDDGEHDQDTKTRTTRHKNRKSTWVRDTLNRIEKWLLSGPERSRGRRTFLEMQLPKFFKVA